jgi:hypothetical protein
MRLCTNVHVYIFVYTIKAPLSFPPTQGGGEAGVEEEEDKMLILF